MVIDTRKERRTDFDILEEVDRTGRLPSGIKRDDLHMRFEKSSEGIGHTPWLKTGDEKLVSVWKNTTGPMNTTPLKTEIIFSDPKDALIEINTDDGPELKPKDGCRFEEMKYPPETRVIKINDGKKEYRARIPLVGGILLGLLGPDGTQENAHFKNPEEAFHFYAKYCAAFSTPVVKRSDVILPKSSIILVANEVAGPEWWSAEARQLSERTISISAAAIAMVARDPGVKRPYAHRFSGTLPDGQKIEDWTPEMLITKMRTYLFGPFPVQMVVRGKFRLFAYCVKVPAFSEEQARLIFEKRMLEDGRVLYHGRPMYSPEGLSAMGYSKGVWEEYSVGSGRIAKMPLIDSIPITAVSKTSVTDFFQAGIRPCLRWSKDDIEVPLINGRWTSDDLGYAFSIIFADELGLTFTSRCLKPSPFTTVPHIYY